MDGDPAFDMAPAVFPTRGPRPYDAFPRQAVASTGHVVVGGASVTAGPGGGGFVGERGVGVVGVGGLRGGPGGAIGAAGMGRSRRGLLQLPPSIMSPVPPSVPHPPRPLTPAPHASVPHSDATDVIALGSQVAELGAMAGFLERPPSLPASPCLGGVAGLRGGRAGRTE